jgi:ubiquinone/menaquinone biosynthesis C-methylase UbiE
MSSISFDRAAEFYDETRGYPPGIDEQIASALVTAANATSSTRFLEIGIGTGRIALPLIKRGYNYTGIDLSEKMMTQLRAKLDAARAAEPSLPPFLCNLQIADATALPFADNTFDAVISVHVLHLIPEWKKVLDEIFRVLKPGGIYLNGSDDFIALEQGIDIYAIWNAIINKMGITVHHSASKSARFVHEELEARGLHPETIRTITYQTIHTPRMTLDAIKGRIWSHTWPVPDDIFAESLRLLEADLAANHANELDRIERQTTHFTITRVQKKQ